VSHRHERARLQDSGRQYVRQPVGCSPSDSGAEVERRRTGIEPAWPRSSATTVLKTAGGTSHPNASPLSPVSIPEPDRATLGEVATLNPISGLYTLIDA
jgi:hypothetical protein